MKTAKDSRTFEFGGFRLDAAPRKLFGPDGASIHLSSRAFDVLLFMIERPGDLLDKATLINAVWPDSVVEEGNLTQCIYALRRALGDTVGDHRFIVTVPGRGYQFAARVQTIDALPIESVTHDDSRDASDPDTIAAVRSKRTRTRVLWLAGSTATVVVVALLGYLFWPRTVPRLSTGEQSAAIAAAPPHTLAVMPFVDLSPAGDMEYFADGIAEELQSGLAKVGALRVIGRNSSFAFKGRNEDARAMGEKLKVESILEGSVRKEGQRIRISAQLVRTKDGYSLWAQSYDRRLDDVLDIQGAIAREVVGALVPMAQQAQDSRGMAAIDASLTRNADAYTAYLRGRFFLRRWTDADLPRARDEFIQAVELDPQFARAHVYLARTYISMRLRTLGNPQQLRSQANSALDQALKLDPQLADVWWIRWRTFSYNAPFSYRASMLERALAADPTDPETMVSLAYVYTLQGRRADALRMYERAYLTDPLWPRGISSLATVTYNFNGDRQRMLSLADELERVAPADPVPNVLRANLAFIEGRAHDWDRWVAKGVELAPRSLDAHGYLSLDYSNLGDVDAALYHARRCQQINPQNAAGWFNVAYILLFSGDLVAARTVVQEVVALHPEDQLTDLANALLQYFTDDCAGAIQSMALARPALGQPPSSLDVFSNPYIERALVEVEFVPMLTWCHRRQGNSARASELVRAFETQVAPPWNPGQLDGLRARMAAATGDRSALISHLSELARTKSMMFAFSRHEPMIQPYLADAEVATLLDKLEARRAEWRKVLPHASMRVPVPGISVAQREEAATDETDSNN